LRVQGVYMSENDSKFIKMMKLKEEKLG
jgi:hypothetical protein